jgi:D-inositol-3-phosphate glycosyltransferase
MQQEKLYDLVFVGGFYWVKGLDLLLAALESLHGGGKSLRLGIVGKFTDAQKRYLMNPIPSSLRSYISFLGVLPHDRIPNIVNSSRFVVIPSRYETFGIVALEAIACGVPVIANNVGALCELVDTSVGRLVWPCDSGSLARAIRECSEDTELQRKCITNGQALAQRYMWKTVVESLIGILTTV